jgi:hypothetical protein
MATEQLTEPATGSLDNKPEAATIEEYLVPGRLYRYVGSSSPTLDMLHMVVLVETFLNKYPSARANPNVDFTDARCVTYINPDGVVEIHIHISLMFAKASFEPVPTHE